MNITAQKKLLSVINDAAEPITASLDYSSILEKIGNANFVMIGEASHGTQEFYQTRIELTKQLILKKGFMAIAIEGDWPDAYRVHRYLQGTRSTDNNKSALGDFQRFPLWMWKNTTMPPFLKWLREHNNSLNSAEKIGFYGLDLYSMHSSMQAVIRYLMKVDPEAAKQAKIRYSCFDHMTVDPEMYGYLANTKIKKSCILEVVDQLYAIQKQAFKFIHENNEDSVDDYFFAMQNARLVKSAEAYYRAMFEDHVSSWNIRDTHMAETLDVIADHLEERFKKPSKIIVWAHNSHVGDARATEMSERGEINLGQLVRERHVATHAIGFSTYDGFVTAASEWDGPTESKKIMPAIPGSYEELFHQVRYKNFVTAQTNKK